MRCGPSSGTRVPRTGPPVRTVSVLGVGLIGGSFALALRSAGFRGRILGVSSPRTIEQATGLGVVDEGCALEDAVPQSDLVYMAQPVERILEQLEPVSRLARRAALVTDAGSTKSAIVRRARQLFRDGPHFIGGHPMAGKEGRGVQIADEQLFKGAAYALVPALERMPTSPVIRQFREWLDTIGCRQLEMQAAEHDSLVAWTSHLPQLVSTALAAAIGSSLDGTGPIEMAGSGLRDMTRLAASSHEVWAGILRTNGPPIQEALGAMAREIEDLRRALDRGQERGHFERARRLRQRIAE